MEKPLRLLFDGERVNAELTRLTEPELITAVTDAWEVEWGTHKDSCPRRAAWPMIWGWESMLGKLGGRVYDLSAEGAGGRLGMVAVQRGEFIKDGEETLEALSLEYVAKGPRAFGIRVGRVAECLVCHAIELSLEAGLEGRVVIPAALAGDPKDPGNPKDNPARLYSGMGFVAVDGDPDGVESVRMEISARDAEEFVRKVRSGD